MLFLKPEAGLLLGSQSNIPPFPPPPPSHTPTHISLSPAGFWIRMSHHREWSPVWHPTSSRSSSLPWWRPLIPASREKLRVMEAIITNTTCERKKKMLPLGYPGFLDWVHIFTIQESRFAAICCNYDPIRFIQIVMQYNTINSILNAIKFTSLMIENSPILIPFNQLQKWATYNTLPLTPFTMQGDLRPLQPDVKKK